MAEVSGSPPEVQSSIILVGDDFEEGEEQSETDEETLVPDPYIPPRFLNGLYIYETYDDMYDYLSTLRKFDKNNPFHFLAPLKMAKVVKLGGETRVNLHWIPSGFESLQIYERKENGQIAQFQAGDIGLPPSFIRDVAYHTKIRESEVALKMGNSVVVLPAVRSYKNFTAAATVDECLRCPRGDNLLLSKEVCKEMLKVIHFVLESATDGQTFKTMATSLHTELMKVHVRETKETLEDEDQHIVDTLRKYRKLSDEEALPLLIQGYPSEFQTIALNALVDLIFAAKSRSIALLALIKRCRNRKLSILKKLVSNHPFFMPLTENASKSYDAANNYSWEVKELQHVGADDRVILTNQSMTPDNFCNYYGNSRGRVVVSKSHVMKVEFKGKKKRKRRGGKANALSKEFETMTGEIVKVLQERVIGQGVARKKQGQEGAKKPKLKNLF